MLNGWNSPHLNMIFHVQVFLVLSSIQCAFTNDLTFLQRSHAHARNTETERETLAMYRIKEAVYKI